MTWPDSGLTIDPAQCEYCKAWPASPCAMHRPKPVIEPEPERTPWLLFMPDGTWDGIIWSPKTLDEAQRKLARPRRWSTLEREGWTVRRGEPGEHRRLLDAKVAEIKARSLPGATDSVQEALL